MKKCVFVLEDDDSLRELFTILLEEEQFEVKTYPTATSFKEGLKHEKPDIIIMDVMLPDGDGLEVCKEVKNTINTSHIPVIMMSAHQDFALVKNNCSAEEFITKPFDIDYFVKKVNLHLSKN